MMSYFFFGVWLGLTISGWACLGLIFRMGIEGCFNDPA